MLSNFKNFFSKKEIVFNNELPNLNPKFYSDLSTKESYDVFFQELKEILNDNDNKIEKFKLELTTLFPEATIHVSNGEIKISYFNLEDKFKFSDLKFIFSRKNNKALFHIETNISMEKNSFYFMKFKPNKYNSFNEFNISHSFISELQSLIKKNKSKINSFLFDNYNEEQIKTLQKYEELEEDIQNLFINKKLSDNLERILPNYETFNKVKNSRDLIKFFKKHGESSYEHIRLNLCSYKIQKNKILFKLTPVSISKESLSFKFYRNNFFEIEQAEMIDLVNKSILFNNEFLENIYSLEFISAKNEVNTGVASFLQSFEDRFFSISIEDLKKRFLDNQALKNNIENFL